MSHFLGDAYWRQARMSDTQIAFMNAYPTWMHAVWAIGVWGSVLGAVLLLLRMRWALEAYALSTLGAIGALLYTVLRPGGPGVVFPIIIVAVCLFFVWYSSTMTKLGVLR